MTATLKYMNIPTDVLKIQKIFTSYNKKLYVVGGAVRDFILNKEPHDYDLVSDASPEQIISMLNGYKADLQGEQFGVVRVFTNETPEGIEIATFRSDISFGRDNKSAGKKVEIGNHITIEDDVKRRDLTINALFYDIEKNIVVDLVGGVDDLNNKIIRTVGIPSERFNEDRLRILRCLRFSATMNYDIHIDTKNAILNDCKLFGISDKDDVSKERIIDEFLKVESKSVNDASILSRYFNLLINFDILKQLFPISFNIDIKQTKSLTILLAQLFLNHKTNNEFINILKNAKLSNKTINHIIGLLEFKNGITSDNVVFLKKIQNSKNIENNMLIEWFEILNLNMNVLQKFINFQLTVSGNDVMADGFTNSNIALEINRREKLNFEKIK